MKRVLAIALSVAVGLMGALTGRAQAAVWPLSQTSLATNGPIFGMASSGDRVYVTGAFTQIGRFNGSGVELRTSGTGGPVAGLPAVNGQISYVLADPSGGWYIGGDFSEVGGVPRAGLAQINADGSLNLGFDPSVNGLVDSLALDGDSLFLGGSFTAVDGVPREGLAGVNATTGALLAFNAHATGQATELCFLPATATTPAVLYAGMGAVLALDPSTGDALKGFHSNIEDTIDAMAVGQNHLYVGGQGGLVALDPMTGIQDAGFNPIPVDLAGSTDFKGEVDSIVVQSDRVLVGGSFNALGGASGPVVALDPDTGGADTGFRPQVNGSVYDMDQVGDDVWIGGAFSSAGGIPASNIAVVDARTGARVPVATPRLNGQVNGIRVSGGSVYAGGEFDLVNPTNVHGFVELQGSTGALNAAFTPPAPRWDTLSADPDALLSSPVQFQGYDPTSRKHPFAAEQTRIQLRSPADGSMLSGTPRAPIANLSGVALSGRELFIDQRIGNHQRFPENEVTVRSTVTGQTLHRFDLPLRGYVSQLLVHDGTLYVAGSFKRVRANGQRANLAILAVSPSTGRLHQAFDPQANGPVYSLAGHGGTLYFAGLFNRVWGSTRRDLAGLDLDESFIDSAFKPTTRANNFTELTSLGEDLGVDNTETYFNGISTLGYGTGDLDPFLTAAGIRPAHVLAVAPTPTGTAVAGEVDSPLGQSYDDSLYFLRNVTGH